ncbi:MAG TPA: glutathione transferase GstA [Candidatus Paceibacterota bacterium]|jgi:glutathione S-transferase
MRLYYVPGACSLSPHIVLRETGLTAELSRVTFAGDTRTTEHGEDFFEVNPKGGYVPALRLDSGEVIAEGVAIVQYIADQAPESHLVPPPATMEHYRLLEWLTYISSEVHKGFGPLFRPDLPEEEKTRVIDRLKTRYAYIDAALAGKEYLNGAYGIADAYAYTIFRWSPRGDIDLTAYPNISAFMVRMEGREAVQMALTEEGLEPLMG